MPSPDSVLKTFFERSDMPTHLQFWEWIDSKRNVLDEIPVADITGLISVIDDRIAQAGGGGGGNSPVVVLPLTVTGSDSYQIPANSELVTIVIEIPATGNVDIGDTPGGTEIYSGQVQNGTPLIIDVKRFDSAAFTVHFTGSFTAYLNYVRYV